MLEKLEELLNKYKDDLDQLRKDWNTSSLSFELYHTEEAYIKGEIEAITTLIAYLKGE